MSLIEHLGWQVQRNKTEGPSQQITFTGILIDFVTMRLSFTPAKLSRYAAKLDTFLSLVSPKQATIGQFRSMIGRLSHISSILTVGYIYLRRCWNCLPHNAPNATIFRPNNGALKDLDWWRSAINKTLQSSSSGLYCPTPKFFLS